MSRAQESRPGRRGLALATVATLGLVGCGSGFDAQTIQPYDPGVGANERLETIDILGALVVANGDETGTVSATLVSEPGSEHELTEVSAQTLDGEEIDVQVDGSFTVTSQTRQPQKLGDASADSDETAVVVLSGDNFAPGDFVEVAFTFSDAEPFNIQLPVVQRGEDGTYDEVAEASA
ncbi:MAG: hypothetical protein H0V13_07125 [Nocardioidaceae bacterium]|nr:hypothetical protein [Nocardioidaceae bacterium]